MRSDTFMNWLKTRGCRFEPHERGAGRGHPAVTVRRDGRSAILHTAGAAADLEHGEVLRVVEALGLDWSDLPGPRSRS